MRQLTPLVAAVALLIASPVLAQSQSGSGTSQSTQSAPSASTSAPSDAMTVTAYYKQNVYDQNNNKIGQIVDLLMTKDGKIDKVVIGAGGFLGMGKHDVMLPFSSVKMVKEQDRSASNTTTTGRNDRNARNANASNSYRLTMDTSKDALKNQPGVKYDRTAMTWVPDNSSSSNQSTTGRKSNR